MRVLLCHCVNVCVCVCVCVCVGDFVVEEVLAGKETIKFRKVCVCVCVRVYV